MYNNNLIFQNTKYECECNCFNIFHHNIFNVSIIYFFIFFTKDENDWRIVFRISFEIKL